ncbi:40713_t:CDS:2, partial [Gigaspora margarita]
VFQIPATGLILNHNRSEEIKLSSCLWPIIIKNNLDELPIEDMHSKNESNYNNDSAWDYNDSNDTEPNYNDENIIGNEAMQMYETIELDNEYIKNNEAMQMYKAIELD